jgi:hypothetical protein
MATVADSALEDHWGRRLEDARLRRQLSREDLANLAVTLSTTSIVRMESSAVPHGRPRTRLALLSGLDLALPLDDNELAALAPDMQPALVRRALQRQTSLALRAPPRRPVLPDRGPGSLAFLSERLAGACGRPMATQILHALIAVFEGVPLTLPESSPASVRHTLAPLAGSPAPPPPRHPPPPPGSVKLAGEDGVTIYSPAASSPARPKFAEPPAASSRPKRRRAGP